MIKLLAYDQFVICREQQHNLPLENGAPFHQSVGRQRLDDMIERRINGIGRNKQVKVIGRDHAIIDQRTEVDYLVPVLGSEEHQR